MSVATQELRTMAADWKTERSIHSIGFMLVSITTFALMQITTKAAYEISCLSPAQLVYCRGIFQFLLNLLYASINDIHIMSIAKQDAKVLLVRVLCGCFIVPVGFVIVQYQPLSLVTALNATYVPITALFGWWIYGEYLHQFDILAILLANTHEHIVNARTSTDDSGREGVASFVGVLMIFWPHASDESMWFNLVCYAILMLSAIAQAMVNLLTRQLVQVLHYCLPPTYHGIGQCIVGGLMMLLYRSVTSSNQCSQSGRYELLCGLIVGVTSFFGQLWYSKALEKEKAGRIVNINYMMLVYMQLADIFLFHHRLLLRQSLGVALIFISGIGICILKLANIIR